MGIVEAKGGAVYLVQLTADRDTLLTRVEDEFRKVHGKNFGKKELLDSLERYPILFEKYPLKEHLTVNTKNLTPEEATAEIIRYYSLI